MDRWVLSQEMPQPCMDGVDAIIVDEKYFGASHGYNTLVLNARSGEPLFMGKGRNGQCLEAFFMSLTQEQRQGILYLGIDRSNTYRSVALRCLPNVKICYDPYHLVSNMNGVVDDVRRGVMAQAT